MNWRPRRIWNRTCNSRWLSSKRVFVEDNHDELHAVTARDYGLYLCPGVLISERHFRGTQKAKGTNKAQIASVQVFYFQ